MPDAKQSFAECVPKQEFGNKGKAFSVNYMTPIFPMWFAVTYAAHRPYPPAVAAESRRMLLMLEDNADRLQRFAAVLRQVDPRCRLRRVAQCLDDDP